MTAAPTPRDGERELAEKIAEHFLPLRSENHANTIDVAEAQNDNISIAEDQQDAANEITPWIASIVAQRVAETNAALEAENRALREDVQMALKCFSLMPEATPHDTKYGIWKMWTDGCNHLKRALAPKEGK